MSLSWCVIRCFLNVFCIVSLVVGYDVFHSLYCCSGVPSVPKTALSLHATILSWLYQKSLGAPSLFPFRVFWYRFIWSIPACFGLVMLGALHSMTVTGMPLMKQVMSGLIVSFCPLTLNWLTAWYVLFSGFSQSMI